MNALLYSADQGAETFQLGFCAHYMMKSMQKENKNSVSKNFCAVPQQIVIKALTLSEFDKFVRSPTLTNTYRQGRQKKSVAQRLAQVVNQILRVFNPDRKTDQLWRNTARQALLQRDRRMRHGERLADQTLHAAQAFGEGK